MICGELDRLTRAAFQTELRDCLVDYYEKVCGMAGVGGVTSVPRRKFAAKTAAADVGPTTTAFYQQLEAVDRQ